MVKRLNRKQAERKVWTKTHCDFKILIDGVKFIMVWRSGGSTLCPLTGLTDKEISNRLPVEFELEV
jgi:hypothetical protein